MERILLLNTIQTWLICTGSSIALALLIRISLRIAIARFNKRTRDGSKRFNDLLNSVLLGTKNTFVFAVAIYLSSFVLQTTPELRILLQRAFVLICLWQLCGWGNTAITFWIENDLKKRSLSDPTVATSVGLIGFASRFVLYSAIVLMAVQNLGFNITTLIAGLGVGGIAVALAVQNILGDLFASLTIVLDKPFVVGDFIVVGEFMGNIEHIGLKTTRIRSLTGEQLIFSNGDLLQSRVRNFKRMTERRVAFFLGVVYQTSANQLERIPQIVRKIIDAQPEARFDRCHFLRFGNSSLDFEVVYWVKNPEFEVHADLAQKVNLEIFRAFEAEQIEFAYPSQTLFIRPQDNSAVRTSEVPLHS